jgi:hypothetical protein
MMSEKVKASFSGEGFSLKNDKIMAEDNRKN